MEKRIEEFRGKAYEQVFVPLDADMGKACGELCCFSVMTSDGPRCMSPVDGRFDGCAIGNFVWKEVLKNNDK